MGKVGPTPAGVDEYFAAPDPGTARVTHDGITITKYGSLQNTKGMLWYRAMPNEEYDFLKKNHQFDVRGNQGYGGICTSRKYCEDGYLGKKINDRGAVRYSHLVEFAVDETKDLVKELFSVGITQKAEDGAVSLGLGRATNNGAGGIKFNELMASGFILMRLVGTAL